MKPLTSKQMKKNLLAITFVICMVVSFLSCKKETKTEPQNNQTPYVPHYWTQLKAPNYSIGYIYDSINKVTEVKAYDSLGKDYRTSKVTYDANGRISKIGDVTLEYDANGLLV